MCLHFGGQIDIENGVANSGFGTRGGNCFGFSGCGNQAGGRAAHPYALAVIAGEILIGDIGFAARIGFAHIHVNHGPASPQNQAVKVALANVAFGQHREKLAVGYFFARNGIILKNTPYGLGRSFAALK